MTQVNLDAGTGNVDLTLTLGGITDADTDADVKSAAATIALKESGKAVANSANNLQTDVDSLTVTTVNGDIYVTESNGLTNLELSAGTANVTLTLLTVT